ncbi:MAG: Cys-Xaa-Xaa-Xaa repeat radical SAM target protein [Alloprevotella sp.]|nr:Cys-Xaa-Xaa-Xaa repeat radical SAM target protein [Alloprevotella sp.]
MEKKNRNEELQSRREFFKRAAKGALPILAVVVLAGTPTIMKAAEKAPMGCNNSCSVGCGVGCAGHCTGTCSAACRDRCQRHCDDGCYNSCRVHCTAISRGY